MTDSKDVGEPAFGLEVTEEKMREVLAQAWDDAKGREGDFGQLRNPVRFRTGGMQDTTVPVFIALSAMRTILLQARSAAPQPTDLELAGKGRGFR